MRDLMGPEGSVGAGQPLADVGREPLTALGVARLSQCRPFTDAAAVLWLGTNDLVSYLQGLFGPLFLGIVGIVALFFLFTREIIRFVQFRPMTVVLYTPSIVQTLL